MHTPKDTHYSHLRYSFRNKQAIKKTRKFVAGLLSALLFGVAPVNNYSVRYVGGDYIHEPHQRESEHFLLA